MIRRATIAFGLLISLLVAATFSVYALDDQPMTQAEFADILARMLELELPEDAADLSDTEIFALQAEMLQQAGVAMFSQPQAGQLVTIGNLVDVLYDALMGPNQAILEGKLTYLVQRGYIAFVPGTTLDTAMNAEDIIRALNIPELYQAVAEAYTRPGGLIRRIVGPLAGTIPPAPYIRENRLVGAEQPATPIEP